MISGPFIKKLLHNHNIKKKSFSGDVKYEANFFPFFASYVTAPILPPYQLPCFANAKPLPEAGNNYLGSECNHLPEAANNYLGSECDHLPEAGNIYIGISSVSIQQTIPRQRRQTNTSRVFDSREYSIL